MSFIWPLTAAWMALTGTAEYMVRGALSGLDEPPYTRLPRTTVDLVIPTYRETKRLPLLIESALGQTEPFNEIIVVDCSEEGDGTVELALTYGATVIQHGDGEGCNPAVSRNMGAAASSAEFVVFSDADVIFPSKFVETVLDQMDEGFLAAHPREVIYDSVILNALQFPTNGLYRPRTRTTRCVAVRMDAFVAVGGYDESCSPQDEVPCREDLALGRRFIDSFGIDSIKVLPLPLFIATTARRQHAQGIGALDLKNWSDPVRALLEDVKQ